MSTRRRPRRRETSHDTQQTNPHPPRKPLGIVLVLGLIVVAVGLWLTIGKHSATPAATKPTPTPAAALALAPGAATGYNVVLITLDTLRADRVACYGYSAVETPNLDALAASGVRFADAITPIPITLASHSSIMTGDYPPTHGVRDNGTFRLLPEHETLAEHLQSAGYATAAFVAAFVLDRRYGVNQGFDIYDDRILPEHQAPGVEPLNPQRTGNIVIDSTLAWLDTHQQSNPQQNFFTWVHLFDPHTPYDPPEPYKSRYAARPYDGEVAFTDAQVGRLIDKLRSLQLLDKTIIIAVGDHGEGLGDHGESTHSLLIYEATMHVPLIVSCPGLIPAGKVVDDRVVATIDLMPTILDLLGLKLPACDGQSFLAPNVDPNRAIYMETLAPKLSHGWSPLHGLRRHHDKYIEAPTPEYYDLRKDPGELENLWTEGSSLAAPLADQLAQRIAAWSDETADTAAAINPDEDAIRKLASLGYVHGAAPPESDTLPDPKEMVAKWDRDLAAAGSLVATGRFQEALPLLQQLVTLAPGDASVWSLLSVAQGSAGQLDAAIASRLRTIELAPKDAGSWVLLANLHYAKNDMSAWEISLQEAERLEPDFGGIYMTRAIHAVRTGQSDQAIQFCAQARQRDPARFWQKSWLLTARIYELMGRPQEAQAAQMRALGQ